MGSKLSAQTNVANANKKNLRKLIHWATLKDKIIIATTIP